MLPVSDRKGHQGPSSPEDPGNKPGEAENTGQGGPLSQKIWEEVRGGVEHFHLQRRSSPPGRLRQFFYGMSLPFHLARALLGNPGARTTYLRVGLLQTVAALALALTCMGSGKKAAEKASQQESHEEAEAQAEAIREVASELAGRHLQKAEAETVRRALEHGAPSRRAPGQDGTASPFRQNDAAAPSPTRDDAGALPDSAGNAVALAAPGMDGGTAQDEDGEDEAGTARRLTAAEAPDAGSMRPRTREEARAEAKARLRQRALELEATVEGRDGGTSSLVEAITALALEAANSAEVESGAAASDDGEDEDEDEDEGSTSEDAAAARQTELEAEDGGTAVAAGGSAPRGGDGTARRRVRVTFGGEESFWRVKGFAPWDLAFWAALFAAMHLAQWVVIALSRDYHDVIAREASLLTGVKPEDEEIQPRVRLDVPWLRKKVKRRWRAAVLFAVGVPAMVVLTVPFLCISSTVFTVLSTLWGAWWLVVFTAAKSEQAWMAAAAFRPPWFLRAWTWLTTRVPGLRWGMLQRYGAFWTRRTEEVLAPVSTVERHPWAFAGLALVRFISFTPPLKFFVRPLIPVASAHLLAQEAAARAAAIHPAPKPRIPAGERGA